MLILGEVWVTGHIQGRRTVAQPALAIGGGASPGGVSNAAAADALSCSYVTK